MGSADKGPEGFRKIASERWLLSATTTLPPTHHRTYFARFTLPPR